jgi:hypothetical protein
VQIRQRSIDVFALRFLLITVVAHRQCSDLKKKRALSAGIRQSPMSLFCAAGTNER